LVYVSREFKSFCYSGYQVSNSNNYISCLVIAFLYEKGYKGLSQPTLVGLIPGIVLGLLLVFRTNAYERFWEGWQIAGMTIYGIY
jgi:putative membrane protein